MIDLPMMAFASSATLVIVGVPLVIVAVAERIRRRKLIGKIDAVTALVKQTTVEVRETGERLATELELIEADLKAMQPKRPPTTQAFPHRMPGEVHA